MESFFSVCLSLGRSCSHSSPENIILGNAKNLVQFDIILDDAIHNVLETPATYPALMRKAWNWKMT